MVMYLFHHRRQYTAATATATASRSSSIHYFMMLIIIDSGQEATVSVHVLFECGRDWMILLLPKEPGVIILLKVKAWQPLVVIPISHDDRHVKPDQSQNLEQSLESAIFVIKFVPIFGTHNHVVSQFQMTIEQLDHHDIRQRLSLDKVIKNVMQLEHLIVVPLPPTWLTDVVIIV